VDILLVDDSRVMRQLVRRTLRQAGYDVNKLAEADNGKEALDKLQGFKPDLVLCDWNMPVMDGHELLVRLRQTGNHVPFGFVTSESTPEIRAKAAGSGALFLLTKPFTSEDLRRVLSEGGLQPQGDAVAVHEEVASVRMRFDHRLLSQLLSTLVHVPVKIQPGPKLSPAITPCVSVTWVDDAGALRYAAFCELPLAAALGAALGLRPAATVAEMIRTRTVSEPLRPDVREVFNVLSRTYNDCGSVHVRLSDISFPPTPSLAPARKLETKSTRLDYAVQLQNYGTGKLTFVSADPNFIAER
jgi:two-component system chemotaxis response regulator CheY